MRHVISFLLLGFAAAAFADEDLSRYEVWITGEPIMRGQALMFKCDKPVQGNTTGDLVLLGATKETINVLGPAYMKAAEKHMKLRLYGVLVPVEHAKDPKAPSVQFITWKLHLPSDPDELPDGQKIPIGPEDKVPGSKVEKPK